MLAGPLLSRAGGARSMPPNPAQKVPPVAHRDPPGPHSRDVNSCPRERQGGYKQIPPDLPGGYRPPGRLLLQLQRLSSVAGFRLTPKGRCVCVCVCFLPIHSGHQVRWTYQPGSHRRKVTQDFSSTFFLRYVPKFFSREGFSHSFPSSTVKSNFVY